MKSNFSYGNCEHFSVSTMDAQKRSANDSMAIEKEPGRKRVKTTATLEETYPNFNLSPLQFQITPTISPMQGAVATVLTYPSSYPIPFNGNSNSL